MKFRIITIILLISILSCSKSDKNNLSKSGVLEATEIIISSKIDGKVIELKASSGSQVQQGDLLGQIDVEQYQIQKKQIIAKLAEMDFHIQGAKNAVLQEKVNYEHIEKQYQRVKMLYENSSATQQEMDDINTNYKIAQSKLAIAGTSLQALEMKKKQEEINLQLIESYIKDGKIIAPISGTILNKFPKEGELIKAGSHIFAIADLSTLWIKYYINEKELGFINLGTKANIMIDSFPNKKFPGEVSWISNNVEFIPQNGEIKEGGANQVYAVKISVPNPEGILKIGMPAYIFIENSN